jgi:hypothetical protein
VNQKRKHEKGRGLMAVRLSVQEQFLVCTVVIALGTAVGCVMGFVWSHNSARVPFPRQTLATADPLRPAAFCRAVRPTVDAARYGPTVLAAFASPSLPRNCSMWVRYKAARQGLGHRLGNWMGGVGISLAWGLPVVVGDTEFDICGNHGCYEGAAVELGVLRGVVPISTIVAKEEAAVRQ